jgi:hypothetical protein
MQHKNDKVFQKEHSLGHEESEHFFTRSLKETAAPNAKKL